MCGYGCVNTRVFVCSLELHCAGSCFSSLENCPWLLYLVTPRPKPIWLNTVTEDSVSLPYCHETYPGAPNSPYCESPGCLLPFQSHQIFYFQENKRSKVLPYAHSMLALREFEYYCVATWLPKPPPIVGSILSRPHHGKRLCHDLQQAYQGYG